MVRRAAPINPDAGPVAQFAAELRALRDRMGPDAPTVDTISSLERIPRSTLYAALKGTRLPSRAVVAALVRSWSGDEAEWMARRSALEADLADPIAHFMARIQQLYEKSGRPTYEALRKYATNAGRQLSKPTISELLAGKRAKVPRWETVAAFVAACHGYADNKSSSSRLASDNVPELFDIEIWAGLYDQMMAERSHAKAPVQLAPVQQPNRQSNRRVLAVARNLSSTSRLLDILPLLAADIRAAVQFTVDEKYSFARGLYFYLDKLGIDVLNWHDAIRQRFDLVMAAHVDSNLADFNGPLVVLPPEHMGVPEQSISSDDHVPVTRLLNNIPVIIVLSRQEQLKRLRSLMPEAVDRAIVVADPHFDRLIANQLRRDHFRRLLGVYSGQRLIVISSVWGAHSQASRLHGLIHQLAAELPVDEFRIALVLHPATWSEQSSWQIRMAFRDALDSGIVILPPQEGWQAALIAADCVIGDYGSLSHYAAALGLPVFHTPIDSLEPDRNPSGTTHTASFLSFHTDDSLRVQIESAIEPDNVDLIRAVANQLDKPRLESQATLQTKLYELLELEPPNSLPRLRAIPDPVVIHGNSITSYFVNSNIMSAGERSLTVQLERFPLLSRSLHPGLGRDQFLVVDENEVEPAFRLSADVLVQTEHSLERGVAKWISQTLKAYPGVQLVSGSVDSGIVIGLADGQQLEAAPTSVSDLEHDESRPDPVLVSAAIYVWALASIPIPAEETTLTIRAGKKEYTVVVKARANPLPSPGLAVSPYDEGQSQG